VSVKGEKFVMTSLDEVRFGEPPGPPQAPFAWDESKHPRGQPENAGQFGPGGGVPAPAPAAKAGWLQRAALKVAEKVFGPTPAHTPHVPYEAAGRRQVTEGPRLPVEAGPVPEAEHAHNLAKLRGLTAAGAGVHAAAAAAVLPRVPPRAVRYAVSEMAEVLYHDTPGDLLREMATRWEGAAAEMAESELNPTGMYDSLHGILQLDGPKPGTDPAWSAAGTLAHELGHAVDGYDNRFSDSEGWKAAWGAEVRRGLGLSAYAMLSPAEGFAEFARAAWAGHVSPADLEKQLPRCSAFWKEHDLWPAS
jgi:hypothetical protein